MAKLPIRSRTGKSRSPIHTTTNETLHDLGLLSLPHELLQEVALSLYLPDLESLTATCRRLRDTCAENIHFERLLARDTFRELSPKIDGCAYHDLLLQIVKREVNPNYIKRFDCTYACLHAEFWHDATNVDDPRCRPGWTVEDVERVHDAVVRATWLEGVVPVDELMDRMLGGDVEAVLVLLVPMLRNLSLFLPPYRARLLQLVFVNVAQAQIVAEVGNPEGLNRLPLRKLHTLLAMEQDNLGMPFPDMIHYMSLPSVRVVLVDSLSCSSSEAAILCAQIRKLTGIPKSRASSVYIRFGQVSRNLAEVLADRFAGPCTIRQHIFGRRSWRDDPDPYRWDHCIIIPSKMVSATINGVPGQVSYDAEPGSPTVVDFATKYANSHFRHVRGDVEDMRAYEEGMRRRGTMPSPQWLALVKFQHCVSYPVMLDDVSFMLEE